MEPDTTIVDQVEKTIEQIPKLPDDVKEVNQFVEASKEFLSDVLFNNIPKIVIALLILWIGWKLVKLISKAIDKMLTRKNRARSMESSQDRSTLPMSSACLLSVEKLQSRISLISKVRKCRSKEK